MAIRGTLTETALADVVQSLALARRTGCLCVSDGREFGTIWFLDGRVAHATLVSRRDRLGETLVRAGALDEADLRAALVEQAADPDTRLGHLLHRRGCVDARAVDAAVCARAAELVYELLAWTQGTFGFAAEVRPDERDVLPGTSPADPGLDAGALLLEAARRADERALIATEVPGSESVFAPLAPARPDEPDDEPLGDAERRVLPLLDARRDVRTLAGDAGLSEFHTARALHALVRRGRARRVVRPSDTDGRVSPARAEEHRNVGVAFARAGMLDDATRELRRVLELCPADAHAHLQLGLVALRAGRWSDAAEVLGEAAALPAPSAAVFHALGLARHRLGQLAAAERAFEEAAQRGLADDPRLGTARGTVALERGDPVAARRWLGAARAAWAARDAVPPAPWYHAESLAALAAGDIAGAERALADGLAAHPGAAPLLLKAAALAAELGRADAADLAARAASADPSSPQAHRLLGDAHHRAGRHGEAVAAYDAAVRLDPTLGPEISARLGALARRSGGRGPAAVAGERACKLHPDHPTARAGLDALRRTDGAVDGRAS